MFRKWNISTLTDNNFSRLTVRTGCSKQRENYWKKVQVWLHFANRSLLYFGIRKVFDHLLFLLEVTKRFARGKQFFFFVCFSIVMVIVYDLTCISVKYVIERNTCGLFRRFLPTKSHNEEENYSNSVYRSPTAAAIEKNTLYYQAYNDIKSMFSMGGHGRGGRRNYGKTKIVRN